MQPASGPGHVFGTAIPCSEDLAPKTPKTAASARSKEHKEPGPTRIRDLAPPKVSRDLNIESKLSTGEGCDSRTRHNNAPVPRVPRRACPHPRFLGTSTSNQNFLQEKVATPEHDTTTPRFQGSREGPVPNSGTPSSGTQDLSPDRTPPAQGPDPTADCRPLISMTWPQTQTRGPGPTGDHGCSRRQDLAPGSSTLGFCWDPCGTWPRCPALPSNPSTTT